MKTHYFDGNELLDCCNEEREVFHYTSPEGFLSIQKDEKLWFSDCQFMNDRSEYVYIKEIFQEAAKSTTHEAKYQDDFDKFAGYILGFPYSGIIPRPLPKEKRG